MDMEYALMATMKFTGLGEYLTKLSALEGDEEIIKRAVYKGAAVVADAIKAELEGLPTISNEEAMHRYNSRSPSVSSLQYISEPQKKGLIDGFGLAPIENTEDYISTKAGFDGYNGVKTKRWPHGQPNAMIARAVVSGTSFMQKNDFVGRATRKTKKAAEAAMAKSLDDDIKNKMK